MEYNKETEKEYENYIFNIVARYEDDEDQTEKRFVMMWCAELLALNKYTIDHINSNGERVDTKPFFDSYKKDRYNKDLSTEDWFDKYYNKDMSEERRNKVLEMITYFREYIY